MCLIISQLPITKRIALSAHYRRRPPTTSDSLIVQPIQPHRHIPSQKQPTILIAMDRVNLKGACVPPIVHPQFAWDVDAAMQYMDRSYKACFSSWVRNPENIQCIASHLRAVTSDYELRRVAQGIRWITRTWNTKSIADLLLRASPSQPMNWQGKLANEITADWPLYPGTVSVFSMVLRGRTPLEAAAFCCSASEEWDDDAVSELVNHMGTILTWGEAYFREFVLHFVLLCKKTQDETPCLHSLNLLLRTKFACSLSMCIASPVDMFRLGGSGQCYCVRSRQVLLTTPRSNFPRTRTKLKEMRARRRFGSLSDHTKPHYNPRGTS